MQPESWVGWSPWPRDDDTLPCVRKRTTMNMADALSGSGGLEAIRWMLRGAPRRALRRELGTLLSAPNILGSCHLRRVRFKPGRKFIAWYDARVRRDGTPSVRPMAVTWGSRSEERRVGKEGGGGGWQGRWKANRVEG